MHVAIDKLSDVLHSCPHFDRLLTLCVENDTHLVGGAIRDGLVGRPITDLDLISPSDPTPIAKLFARQIGGHWFWLDKERLQSRVVVRDADECLHYDFAQFRAPDLEKDLLDRDFTINTLALPLAEKLSQVNLVDPCRGLEDLQRGSLKMVGRDSFTNDPLRIIKGVRHATVLSIDVENETLQAMQNERWKLESVAPERVRLEIWKTLESENAEYGLELLCECGAGEVLFGLSFSQKVEGLFSLLINNRESWRTLSKNQPIVKKWLIQEIEQGLSNETLLLWTFLLILIDRNLPVQIAEKWRLSRKAKASISAVAHLNNDVLNDFLKIARNERALFWWAARYRIDPKILLLTITTFCSREPACSLNDICAWVPIVGQLGKQPIKDYVDGNWLRNVLNVKEGPEMTKALNLLRDAEISGQVSNHEEAMWFLGKHYQNKD